ncbi:MAG: hypothetical protein M1816_007526 [Peltula sp. TS41687]|nr:MAG: hypothetical protein M1816_007526 [Peltula sp. TS41687]
MTLSLGALTHENLTTILTTTPPLSDDQLYSILSTLEPGAALLVTDDGGVDPSDLPLLQLYYTAHLFSLLLINDLNEARFVTHRFPPPLLAQRDPVLLAATDLLRAVWARRYPAVYFYLGVHGIPAPDGTSTTNSPQWPAELRPLVQRYLEHFRGATVELLGRAYTSVPVKLVGWFLGVDVEVDDDDDENDEGKEMEGVQGEQGQGQGKQKRTEELVAFLVEQRGWRWDEAVRVLYPRQQQERQEKQRRSMMEEEKNSIEEEESIARLVGLIVGDLGE